MNRIWLFLRGYLDVELTGASPDWLLNRLTSHRIPFWNIRWMDEFTVRISVFSRDVPDVKLQAEKAMCRMDDVTERGLRELLRGLWVRPVLWICLLAGILLVLTLPKFVLFYTVEGNDQVPEAMILRNLDTLGIGVGVYGPSVHNQWVEDHMLNRIGKLERITVNQSGCKAQVLVRERTETPQVEDRKGFSNIVASRAAILLEQSVWTGQAMKKPGDVVVEGELLVSGVVDLERTFLLTRAQAEIYGQTWRQYEVVTPMWYLQKQGILDKTISVWVEFGKRRIKIFGNSGISTAVCDKMVNRKILSLPGGNLLPVSLVMESVTERSFVTEERDEALTDPWLKAAVEQIASDQMIAGEILNAQHDAYTRQGLRCVRSILECREMIARTVEANWIEEEYEHD